ncbi:MAG: hypothetical protein OXO50_10325 [Caldilineaceae bacterium]|nr:hypothetical protein [Caldilineaceae bacterium]
MIDRHRSLIHTAVAGLVGLTLGLFIGWWVWPVQWIETPGASPAASAPAQSVERPAVENEEPASNYSAFLDWVSQGLLYVAAALLLAGGVVIGYQLLRQSQGKDPTGQPFPLPFNRKRSNQATAERKLRAKAPPLAGKSARQRQPSLNWLRRESESESASTSEEPVFREQPVSVPRPDEWSAGSPIAGGDASLQGVQGSETDPISSQQDDILSHEETRAHFPHSSIAPTEQQVDVEHGLDSPESLDAPETVVEAFQRDEDEQDADRFAEGFHGGLARVEPAADGEGNGGGGVLPAGALAADYGSEVLEDSHAGEDPEPREESWRATPAGPATFEAYDERDVEAGAGMAGQAQARATADPEGPVEWEEQSTEAPLIREQEAETVGTGFIRSETGQVDSASKQLVGQFEANYAFGIQSYDESFTINAEDGELLGACGMGINESVDRDAANSDQVRLLDVWLYDRSAVRSVSQPLISPGFNVLGLDDYAEGSGSDSSSPLEVVPGLTCTLQSDSIVVECSIKSATFLEGEREPMPFRSVNVSLAVYVSP